MSLIIATGSNIGDRKKNLLLALNHLQKKFELIASSQICETKAVDFLDQPDFLNQVHEFKLPDISPLECLHQCLAIEEQMGRVRLMKYGPRLIDIDIIFWNHLKINENNLIIPHPKWEERTFVREPLKELPWFKVNRHLL